MLTFTEAGLLSGLASTKINPVPGAEEVNISYCTLMYAHAWRWPEMLGQIVLCGAALQVAFPLNPLTNLVSLHFFYVSLHPAF